MVNTGIPHFIHHIHNIKMLYNVDVFRVQPTAISHTPVMPYVREVSGIAAFFNT
jgi:hypothetical protein